MGLWQLGSCLSDQESKQRWSPGIGRGRVEVRRLSGGKSSVRLSKEDGDFQFVCRRLGDILEVGILGVQVEEHL